jgi:hypothetical protein
VGLGERGEARDVRKQEGCRGACVHGEDLNMASTRVP